MKSICFFNNKGGVGKTTLICNVASFISMQNRLRVLLVDADPQCNSTQLLIAQQDLEEMYQPRRRQSNAKGERQSGATTLYDVLLPIARGDSHIAASIAPLLGTKNKFEVDLIAGHPKVAILEDILSQAWVNFGSGDLGGARRTNWSTQLLQAVEDRYDLVFFDVGPSLGALNRTVLIGTDYFVAPMGCDIFSMAGVDNIALWLKEWLKSYKRSFQACLAKWSEISDDRSIRNDVSEISRFVGYTIQQYITKSIGGERRATKAYDRILNKIPEAIRRELGAFVPGDIDKSQLRLGDVPNMFSLVPLAQNANVPIHKLESADGLVGAQYSQKKSYMGFIEDLAKNTLENIGMGVAV